MKHDFVVISSANKVEEILPGIRAGTKLKHALQILTKYADMLEKQGPLSFIPVNEYES